MSEKRRDHRGRILHNGEIQLSDGRYRFKYVDEMGKERCVYSWRLDHNDATPKGKRRTLSLREMEKKIQADHFEQIATNGGNMTVLKLVEKYTSTKTGVRPTTVAGYGTVINLLKKDPFGKRRIDRVRISDAKCWLIHLQQVEKKSYSSIHSIRGVLRPAFQLAVDDDLIRKNPFQFQLMEVVVNDSVTREAISRAEERKFLRFVKEDPHFCRYYEGIYILFKTGLRISEFCGLTISDIDFKEHTINIDHQLQKKSKIRNANNTLKEEVSIPTSTLKVGIAEILKNEGFIKGYKVEGEGAESNIIITLKYRGKDKVITDLKRISKPGLRVYAKVNEIPRVLNGLGIVILSTSQGLMTDKEARAKQVGGEVLAYIW